MPIVCRELCRSSPIMFKEEIPIMAKSYADLMNEISADELYNRLLAHGLFADKLPPILSQLTSIIIVKRILPHFLIVGNNIFTMRAYVISMFHAH